MARDFLLRSLTACALLANTAYGTVTSDWADSSSAFRIQSGRLSSDAAKRDQRLRNEWSNTNLSATHGNQRFVFEFEWNSANRGSFIMRRRTIGVANTQAELLIYVNLGNAISAYWHNFGSTSESSSGAGDGVGGQGNASASLSGGGMTNGTKYRLTTTVAGLAGVMTGGSLTSNSTTTIVLGMERWTGSAWTSHNAFASGTSPSATITTSNNNRVDYGACWVVADEWTSNNRVETISLYTEDEVTALSLPLNDPDRSAENDTQLTLTANPVGGIPPLTYAWKLQTAPGVYTTVGAGNPYTYTGLTPGIWYNAQLTITDAAAAVINRNFGFRAISTTWADARDSLVNVGAKGDSYTNSNNGADGQTYGFAGTGTGTGWGAFACDILAGGLGKTTAYYPRAANGVGSQGAPDDIAADLAWFTARNVSDVVVWLGYNDDIAYPPASTVANITTYAEGLLTGVGTTVRRVWVQAPAPKWSVEQAARIESIGALLQAYCDARSPAAAGKVLHLGTAVYDGLTINDEDIGTDGTHPARYKYHGTLIGTAMLQRGPWGSTTTSSGGAGSVLGSRQARRGRN